MFFFNDVNLSDTEKLVFVRLCLKMIVADSKVENEEAAIIKKIGSAYGFTNKMLFQAKAKVNEAVSQEEYSCINSAAKKHELLKIMCLIAGSDEITDEEAELLLDTAEKIGVSSDKLMQINKMVQDFILLQARNDYLMSN